MRAALSHVSEEPVAWLRPGEYEPIQNAPFGAMWISDKDDLRAFPVYARPPFDQPSAAVPKVWQLVPTEPTDEMLKALAGGHSVTEGHYAASMRRVALRQYAALLTAVPNLAAREDLVTYYARQIEWSRETFGPALRTRGIIDHIRKELREIEQDPRDLSEWIDVVILAMDGFWRHGGQASDLMPALLGKQKKNMARVWPDWRSMSEDQAIEHDRSVDQPELPVTDENDNPPRTLEDLEPPMPEWVERVYRYMAEGDLAAAMDEFSREFGLAAPSHAKAVADMLSGAKV
ncbi:hypothetical protein BBX50_16400 [Ensifer sp. LC11]|nr:hypothetical protein BBX50_16400 [Ensifer sp. LC11]